MTRIPSITLRYEKLGYMQIQSHSPAVSEIDQLDTRIQLLPQELQDMILKEFLQDDQRISIEPVEIFTSDFQTPISLRLCHKTRAAFVKIYFTETVFYIDEGSHSDWTWIRFQERHEMTDDGEDSEWHDRGSDHIELRSEWGKMRLHMAWKKYDWSAPSQRPTIGDWIYSPRECSRYSCRHMEAWYEQRYEQEGY